MYKRLIILSAIILAAIGGLVWLGHHSIRIWALGMEGARLGEFAAVAEQIRQDVKTKLDDFLRSEQSRPYTDYLSYYVPENIVADQSAIRLADQQQIAVLRSPLNGQLENGFAYGNFQIEPDGTIITPNDDLGQPTEGGSDSRQVGSLRPAADSNDDFYVKVQANRINIKNNLLPVLTATAPTLLNIQLDNKAQEVQLAWLNEPKQVQLPKDESVQNKGGKSKAILSARGKNYPIESLQEQEQKAQVIQQKRAIYERNITSNVASPQQGEPSQTTQQGTPIQVPQAAAGVRQDVDQQTPRAQPGADTKQQQAIDSGVANQTLPENQAPAFGGTQAQPMQQGEQTTVQYDRRSPGEELPETVQIRIEPFVPLVVPGENAEQFVFGGQVFLLRHVQIEDKHFLQGFQLNENKLVDEVRESAQRFMREGMGFELSQAKNASVAQTVAYTAVLDFGFGQLVLNLKEIDPAWISKQIRQLQDWYLSVVTVVLLAVTLGLAGLWHNARAQIKLAQKKDDFISAVSHELRTPLTSIRMYSEMLEKNWVKSQDKLTEYYRSMRQESERLSRLIENVLDFSRIQRKQKKYMFKVGDINRCVADVVEMMSPYATQRNFSIKTELGQPGQTAFDNDAITQIVVNLLDNAIKYACNAEDRTITVRTKSEGQFVLIEVEDHGPGVPHRQHKKVFEEFYRIGAEATRETTGTGLGLALVKKFAQAHNGFVEITNAKPTGAIFRVGLSTQM